jgi:hypothetical protein
MRKLAHSRPLKKERMLHEPHNENNIKWIYKTKTQANNEQTESLCFSFFDSNRNFRLPTAGNCLSRATCATS